MEKPLDYYSKKSNGVFIVGVYQIFFNEKEKNNKLFLKNMEIIGTDDKPWKISLIFTNSLRLQSEKTILFILEGKFMMKMFNLFFRKNVLFNYNMT